MNDRNRVLFASSLAGIGLLVAHRLHRQPHNIAAVLTAATTSLAAAAALLPFRRLPWLFVTDVASADPLYAGLLPRAVPKFRLPSLDAKSRVLVLGAGGGCDVFAAYALAQLWSTGAPSGSTVLYGSCIGKRALPEDSVALAPHLHRLSPIAVPLRPGDEGYGSVRLENSVPRGAEGSPLLFVVPHDGKDSSGATVEELSAANARTVRESLDVLRLDHVLSVDLGGDSLTGGVDFSRDVELGRDRQVMHALAASGVPFTHLLLGPGADGETSVDEMAAAVADADGRGAILGAMPRIGGAVPLMAALASSLQASRTPNIIAGALRKLESGEATPSSLCTVSRHGNTQRVPYVWLTMALALRGERAAAVAPTSRGKATNR